MSRGRPLLGRSLFWQIYLHGLLILLAVLIAVAAAGLLIGGAPAWREHANRLSRYLSSHAADLDRPDLLGRDLGRERELLGIEVSIYRLDGTLVASSAEPPFPQLSGEDLEAVQNGPRRVGHAPLRLAGPIHESGRVVAYAIGSLPRPEPHVWRAVLTLMLVLAALALGSYPLARAISKPVERLTETARRLGAGDLAVRSEIRSFNEVGTLAVAFDEMADRLEKLVRREKELLANVSHEFRTPLARLRVALEMAEEGSAEAARRYLREMGTDLGELDKLVEDVLTAARLDLAEGKAGETFPGLKKEPQRAGALLEGVALRFKKAHPDRTLLVEAASELPSIEVDGGLLRRALENLLDNAAKYSDAPEPVVLRALAADGGLRLEVADRGIGIEPQDRPKLFTPFFRTERSRARGKAGVGLGLALAKRIVEAHGGVLTVDSAPGRGTTVTMALPGD